METISLDEATPGDRLAVFEPKRYCLYPWRYETTTVVCTREYGHDGEQHVAEDERGLVVSVHPWV